MKRSHHFENFEQQSHIATRLAQRKLKASVANYSRQCGRKAVEVSGLGFNWGFIVVSVPDHKPPGQFQIAQVSCFLPNCYRGLNTLWSTLLSCFGIRTLQSYWNIAKFLEVCGLDKFLTVRAFYSSTVWKLHAVIKLRVSAILECSCI